MSIRSKLLKGSGILLGLGILAFLGLQIDDKPNPDAQAYLAEVARQTPSPRFIYLLGMLAPKGQDPMQVGRQRLTYTPEQTQQMLPRLPELDKAWRCDKNEPSNCYGIYLKRIEEIPALLQKHHTLRQRYAAFMQRKDKMQIGANTHLAVHFGHLGLIEGQRLALLEAFYLAHKGQPTQAIALIMQDYQAIQGLQGKWCLM